MSRVIALVITLSEITPPTVLELFMFMPYAALSIVFWIGLAYDNSFNDYVCTDEIGKLLSPNYLSRTFGKLLKQNGLRHIRYHDLRHTCASLLLKNGIPMKAIQEWLGNSTFEVTLRVYVHSSIEQKAACMNRLSSLI